MAAKASGRFRFKSIDNIGDPAAETDRFLQSCFVDTGLVEALEDCSDQRRIVVGRTGSGKSALLLTLENRNRYVHRIQPDELALSYLSNSTILRYLLDLGVNLNVFFKLLWRHVLVVEFVRMRFSLDSQQKTVTWLQRFRAGLFNRKSTEALDYLEEWGASFWKETDYRVREVTQQLESQMESALQVGVGAVQTSLSDAIRASEETRTEVKHRAQDVVNRVQMQKLSHMVDLLNDVLDDDQKQYYITIDDLDTDWVDDQFRYRLVRALVEALRDFRRVRNAKIVVAVRQDLLERAYRDTRGAGFQQEKYRSSYLTVRWSRAGLEQILARRVNELVRRRYSGQPVGLRDIVSGKATRQKDAVEYLLSRTLQRPRDAIAYLNAVLEFADGRPIITPKMLKDAEQRYSSNRLNALEDEWYGDFPNLGLAARTLLRGRPESFTANDIADEDVEMFVLELLTEDESAAQSVADGRIRGWAESYFDGRITVPALRASIIAAFIKVGLLEYKPSTSSAWDHCILADRQLEECRCPVDTKLRVHPAFAAGVGAAVRD